MYVRSWEPFLVPEKYRPENALTLDPFRDSGSRSCPAWSPQASSAPPVGTGSLTGGPVTLSGCPGCQCIVVMRPRDSDSSILSIPPRCQDLPGQQSKFRNIGPSRPESQSGSLISESFSTSPKQGRRETKQLSMSPVGYHAKGVCTKYHFLQKHLLRSNGLWPPIEDKRDKSKPQRETPSRPATCQGRASIQNQGVSPVDRPARGARYRWNFWCLRKSVSLTRQ